MEKDKRHVYICAWVLFLIILSEFFWYLAVRQTPIQPDTGISVNQHKSIPDFEDAIQRYSEAKDGVICGQIAREVATTHDDVLIECGRRMHAGHFTQMSPLSHFAGAYIARGQKQQNELIELLHTKDEELLLGLLSLLRYSYAVRQDGQWAGEGDPNAGKPLGGTEIIPHIANVAKHHPQLATEVAMTLGSYGPLARAEVDTVLRALLSTDEKSLLFFGVLIALHRIDADGVFTKFGLNMLETLTNMQRAEIEKYLKNKE